MSVPLPKTLPTDGELEMLRAVVAVDASLARIRSERRVEKERRMRG